MIGHGLQVFASLPFIPSWLVSLPAVGQLAFLQSRPAAATVLLGGHFAAWYASAAAILRRNASGDFCAVPRSECLLQCLLSARA